jgi:hemerythrin-like domain-containing protein
VNVADALTGEHGVFHLLIEQLEDAAARCRTVDELRSAAAPLAISLLAHARVEEETLFTPLERQIGEAGPLHCLREEHEAMDLQLRALFREPDLEATRRAVHEVLAAARRHLGKEEQVLFQVARKALQDDDLQKLGAHWARARGITLGD